MGAKKKHYFQLIDKGENFLLADGVIIGRGNDANIVIPDEKISSNHLKIVVEENKLSIVDLDTSNGTILNDQDLSPNIPYGLNESDKVCIGKVSLIYSHKKFKPAKETNSDDKNVNYREIAPSEESIHFELDDKAEFKLPQGDQFNPETQLKYHNSQIEKLKIEIEDYKNKVKEKAIFTEELEALNTEHKELLDKEYELKKVYKQFGSKWDELKERVEVLTKQLEEAQTGIEKLGPKMKDYQKLTEIKDTKATLVAQLKSLSRKNLAQKILDKEKELEDAKIIKRELKKKVNEVLLIREKEKEIEKEKIREEIKKLQAKLGD